MTQTSFLDSGSSAVFSPCERFRYTLTREVNRSGAGTVVFLLLNPSTATAELDDPTIRRTKGYAGDWGYRRLVILNLFAFRATDPADMKAASDPIGPDNDRHLIEQTRYADAVVCGWGNHGSYLGRAANVARMLTNEGVRLLALRVTHLRQPQHPLYLPADLKPVPFEELTT